MKARKVTRITDIVRKENSMDKVQKIREEVERLKKETSIGLSEHENGVEQGRMEIIDAISLFPNSIQEEPVSEDLEEACDSYYNETWDEHGGRAMVVDGCHDIWFPSLATDDFFKAGAKWQKEQMMKNVVLETKVMKDSDGDGIDTPYEEWITLEDAEIPFIPDNIGLKDGDKVKVIILKDE